MDCEALRAARVPEGSAEERLGNRQIRDQPTLECGQCITSHHPYKGSWSPRAEGEGESRGMDRPIKAGAPAISAHTALPGRGLSASLV